MLKLWFRKLKAKIMCNVIFMFQGKHKDMQNRNIDQLLHEMHNYIDKEIQTLIKNRMYALMIIADWFTLTQQVIADLEFNDSHAAAEMKNRLEEFEEICTNFRRLVEYYRENSTEDKTLRERYIANSVIMLEIRNLPNLRHLMTMEIKVD